MLDVTFVDVRLISVPSTPDLLLLRETTDGELLCKLRIESGGMLEMLLLFVVLFILPELEAGAVCRA